MPRQRGKPAEKARGLAAVDVDQSNGSTPDLSTCALCRDKHPFRLPEALVQAVRSGGLILFAGAGISTESRKVFPDSLREELTSDLAAELGRQVPSKESFSAIASAYEEAFGRRGLIQRIRKRLDYALAFPAVYSAATAFHSELSTIPGLDSIVTTNWDTYFEDEVGAIPITIPEDYAYWDLPGRKVFKIHGSVTNLSTIVATVSDYARCLQGLQTGVIGSSLKHLLATKSALFVGYSFGDEDFNQVYDLLKREMKDILPRSFIVTLDHRITPTTHSGATVLHTDATFFIEKLKERLVQDKYMIADERFEGVEDVRMHLRRLHEKVQIVFPPSRYPAVIYTASYQDGLADGFDRILAKRKTGFYSDAHNIHRTAHTYHLAQKQAIRRKRYYDAAYIEGYSNAMLYLLFDDKDRKALPLFHVFGETSDLVTLAAYRRALRRAPTLHKGAIKAAQKMTATLGDGLTVHHPPFLDSYSA